MGAENPEIVPVEGGASQPATQTPANQSGEFISAAEYRKLKSQYDGLNGFKTKLTTEYKTAQEEWEAAKVSYEQRIAELEGKAQSAEKTAAQIAAEKADFESKYQTLNAEKTVRSKVRAFATENNAPGLIEFFEDGLLSGLESMDEESLTAHLTKLAGKIGKITSDVVTETLSGSTPTPPGGTVPGMTLQDVTRKMDERLRSHGVNDPEYRQLLSEYTRLSREALLPKK